MYEEFYGFVQSPFTLAPDPRFLYLSESHEEALRLLLQSIRRGEGFIVLAGDIGTGKTTLCRALLEQLDTNTFTSLILNPFLSVEELLREMLLDFGVVSRDALRSGRIAAASTHELIRALHDFLLSLVPLKCRAVLIVDEAQHLSPLVLEQIRVISNLETNEAKLFQIVLVGQLNLLDVLAEANMRQLDQRISLRAMLKPLTRDEVEAYVTHRMTVARGSSTVAFDAAALDAVHAITGGVPRVINLLCDRSLTLGASSGATAITPAIVEEAADALSLKRPVADLAWWARVPRWAVAIAALLILVALVLLFAPLHRLVDATAPESPAPRMQIPPSPQPAEIPPPEPTPAPRPLRPPPAFTPTPQSPPALPAL